VRSRDTSKEPAPELVDAVLQACHRRGLIILKAGLYDNVIRLHIPFVASDAVVNRGLDILEEALMAGGAAT
jgi:4-aminobutyrate aminotransferase / (S)-3-amino-2-methylpropionate transaminase / 5-aminovalerate transaminase